MRVDNIIMKALKQCFLFNDVNNTDMKDLLKHTHFYTKIYDKNEYIAFQEDKCSSIGIIIEGSVNIKKMFASGKAITITTIEAVNIFGEALIFSTYNKYPSTIIAAEQTQVVYITKEVLIDLCTRNNQLLRNYLKLLSNKMLMLVDKIQYLSYQTIKQKMAAFILDEYHKQKKNPLTFHCNRREMAERLGITRPSLSREMINMKNEGLINYHKNVIEIFDLHGLENLLL